MTEHKKAFQGVYVNTLHPTDESVNIQDDAVPYAIHFMLPNGLMIQCIAQNDGESFLLQAATGTGLNVTLRSNAQLVIRTNPYDPGLHGSENE